MLRAILLLVQQVNVLGNGYYLSGLSVGGATYGNSNVAAYLTIYNGNVLSSNVNISGNLALRAGANLVLGVTGNIITCWHQCKYQYQCRW
jgi:hypothetical protein